MWISFSSGRLLYSFVINLELIFTVHNISPNLGWLKRARVTFSIKLHLSFCLVHWFSTLVLLFLIPFQNLTETVLMQSVLIQIKNQQFNLNISLQHLFSSEKESSVACRFCDALVMNLPTAAASQNPLILEANIKMSLKVGCSNGPWFFSNELAACLLSG